MTDSTDNARGPERIWLQSDGGLSDKTKNVGSVTWCRYAVNNTDTEYIRADLAPEPLADPRVWELVEAVEDGIKSGLLPKTSASEVGAAKYSAQVRAADRLRSALAALSPTGGNDE